MLVDDNGALAPASSALNWKDALLAGDNVKWIASTLLIPLTVAIWGQVDKANHRASLAAAAAQVETRQDVDQMTALLPGLSSADARQRTLALVVMGDLVAARKASGPLLAAYRDIQKQAAEDRSSDDPSVKAIGAQTDASLRRGIDAGRSNAPSSGGGMVAQAPLVAVREAPPVSTIAAATAVYLQIYAEAQRPAAQELQTALERAGVPVIGIENVVATQGSRVLATAQHGTTDVRFFFAADQNTAANLVSLVQASLPQYGEPTVHDLSARQTRARPGTIEIWLPCAAKGVRCTF